MRRVLAELPVNTLDAAHALLHDGATFAQVRRSSSAPMPPTPPEPGQLVEVRRRRYVVGEVLPGSVPGRLGDGRGGALLSGPPEAPQHLVTLSSIEDDALGEELQVVWELEPGARVHEAAALPEPVRFDAPSRLDAFLDAVRWGAVSSADLSALQAPFRSGITIEDYQLDPLVRAIQMPRVNLLIADDVGLGKTIEAGLVLQELVIRHRVRRALIVCPSSLQIQWREQMQSKFGLDFRIVDSALMRELRRRRGIHVNPWTHFPRLITSIDFLKRDHPMRLMREALPAEGESVYPRRFDLMIVDEAHNVAPSGSGRYAVDSLRTQAIRSLVPHFEHRLFLTATPHNGYAESFSALLELLDNQRFARGVPPEPGQLARIMVRRLKTELPPRWDGRPRFQPRLLEAILVGHSDAERDAHQQLQRYAELRRQGGDEGGRTAAEFVLKLLKKRLFSSPAAFASTLAQHRATLEGKGARAVAAELRRPSAGLLRRMLAPIEEEEGDDADFEEAAAQALEAAAGFWPPLSAEERALLDSLQSWAQGAAERADSKVLRLLDWIDVHIRPGGVWSDERVIVFTEYRATQNWLQGLMAGRKLTADERLMVLHGGVVPEERERIKAAFLAEPASSPVRILLATDAASEGIDLQRHCRRLIHYEIPWNPNRLEQRNGRIDRHGQPRQPLIYHFAPAGLAGAGGAEGGVTGAMDGRGAGAPSGLEGDLEFLERVVRKVDQIRADLGSVGPVIADQVAEAMLGRRRSLDTAAAEQKAAPTRRMLQVERDISARVARLGEQLDATRETLRLSPASVAAAVIVALELAGQPPLEATTLPGVWPDPEGLRAVSPVYRLPLLSGSWSQAAEGLPHPHTGRIRPITFEHEVAAERDDVVLVHLGHRLARMALRLLRAEVWAPEETRSLSRVTARLADRDKLPRPAVIAHARLVVTGGDSHRLHEEVVTAGRWIDGGRFPLMNVGEVQAALAAALPRPAPPEAGERFRALWADGLAGLLSSALEQRIGQRRANLGSQLEERAKQEAANIRAVLEELARAIQKDLAEEIVQLDLFSPLEREQLRRDESALGARLAQIPSEILEEERLVRARYADPVPRSFPVAVTFLLPQGLR